ncbi:hypothetical protein DW914_06715 [Roseburia inulinivorans]|uniref:Uncharacterized protein n=1 Tax=Roseburia inulinivorans TaxID=360807 RepID=A0A3R6AJS6_9FIRM|nr:hypothetical protein DW914_06715 [Roseburia inulinivorans]
MGVCAPNQNLPGSSGSKFSLSEIRDVPDTQINVSKAKPIMNDLDQLEDEAPAMRSVYLEGGSRGVWGSALPTKICPVLPVANLASPRSGTCRILKSM